MVGSYQTEQRELFEQLPPKKNKFVNFSTIDYNSPFTSASRTTLRPEGVIICTMQTAREEYSDILNSVRALSPTKTSTLIESLECDGTLIVVPKDTKVKHTLELKSMLSDERSAEKNVIVLKRGSQANVIWDATSRHNDSNGLLVSSTLIVVKEGAHLTFSEVNDLSDNSTQLAHLEAHLYKDARITWSSAMLGGIRSSIDRSIHLLGEGADGNYAELFAGSGKQLFDAAIELVHHVPNTQANSLSHGILRDRSKSTFFGIIRIKEGAQKTNSFLAQHGMLLSPDTICVSIPSLEIGANDVKASHAASAGQIDEDQIFYLESRGINRDEAKRLIVMGFLQPAIERIPSEEVQERILIRIEEKWPRH